MTIEDGVNEHAPAGAGNVLLLATEKKVHGFDLHETFRVSIGRHDSNDLRFNSRNVSNYHAEILREAEALVIRDLGSTNGTYVNEERVRRRQLAHGDRIRIGNYEIVVKLTSNEGARAPKEQAPVVGQTGTIRRGDSDNGGVPLRQLLLGLCGAGESVRLSLARNDECETTVYIHNGRVVHAESGAARAEKALYRAFEWRRGSYRIEAFPANDSVPRDMAIPVETLVEEAEQQAKQLEELMGALPPPDTPLRLREGCKMRICDLSPAEIEVFQCLIRHGTLGRALEETPMTDLKVMSTIHALLRKKVFEIEQSSSLLEQTNVLTRQ